MLVTMMQKIAANRCNNLARCFIHGSVQSGEKWSRTISSLRSKQLLHLIEKQDQAVGADALSDNRFEKVGENPGSESKRCPEPNASTPDCSASDCNDSHKGIEGVITFTRHHTLTYAAPNAGQAGLFEPRKHTGIDERGLAGPGTAANNDEPAFRCAHPVENFVNLSFTPEEYPRVLARKVHQAGIR